MKRSVRLTSALLIGLLAGCSGGGGSDDSSSNGADSSNNDFSSGDTSISARVIDSFVNGFILPDYAALDQAGAALQAAVQALVNNPSEANLQAAKTAWINARVPYEKGEAALFGPIDFYGFDPALDSWPVNKTDLDTVLAGGTTLNAATVANFETTLKGFHTIEYLLWGEDSHKTAGSITDREKQYLVATADDLRGVTSSLYAAWATGFNGQRAYALELTEAGRSSASFATQQAVLEQLVQGMIGICDEVANGKIADPFAARNPNIVESQFSFNSIADFSDDIRGVQEIYTGALSIFVADRNAGLDAKVRSQVAAAIAAIQQIPEPFRDAIQDTSNDGTIRNAQTAVRTLQDTLQGEVLPLVLS